MWPPGCQTATVSETIYERMGGAETFTRLVGAFYRQVAHDRELRALYPEQDLGPAEWRLRMFLEQYWGGPTAYSTQRGHPRLRMRHRPFAVTPAQRDRWLRHMFAACDEVGLDPELDALLRDYFTRTAHMLVNTPDEPDEPGGPDKPEVAPPSRHRHGGRGS